MFADRSWWQESGRPKIRKVRDRAVWWGDRSNVFVDDYRSEKRTAPMRLLLRSKTELRQRPFCFPIEHVGESLLVGRCFKNNEGSDCLSFLYRTYNPNQMTAPRPKACRPMSPANTSEWSFGFVLVLSLRLNAFEKLYVFNGWSNRWFCLQFVECTDEVVTGACPMLGFLHDRKEQWFFLLKQERLVF